MSTKDELHIIDCGGYYTVANRSFKARRANHCHFNKYDSAATLKRLINQNRVPHSPYMRESARRVSINEEYLEKLKLYD